MAHDNFGGPAEPPVRVPLPGAIRWVIVLAVCLLFVVAAFVGGWFTGRNTPKASEEVFGQPVAPAPADWTSWNYPGSERLSLMTSAASGFSNVRTGPVHTVRLATADSFAQVLSYYATQLGQPGITGPGMATGVPGTRLLPGGTEVYSCTYVTTNRPGMKGKAIGYRTSNYDLVIDVTRADGEKQQTHIVITYMPNP